MTAGNAANERPGPRIDLRSDTITQPTAAMREAIASAVVGDDVLGDDPTVNALERRTAEMLGKPAAVFMPSGTMTNQVALRTHTEPGDEVLLADNAHVYYYEVGAPAAISGVMCRLLPTDRGQFGPAAVRAALRPANIHYPVPKLLCLENTSNRGGGSVWPVEQVAAVGTVAREHGLKMHLDGARLWNAAVASGRSEAEIASHFDSVSVCFSKGLGAPVGSALTGDEAFIARARRFRKMFGGGMRQAGILAAGALYALENHRDRLAEDHAHARRLGEALAQMPGAEIDPATVETNIVIFHVRESAADVVTRLGLRGLGVLATGPDQIRAVTSLAVTAGQLDEAVEILAAELS